MSKITRNFYPTLQNMTRERFNEIVDQIFNSKEWSEEMERQSKWVVYGPGFYPVFDIEELERQKQWLLYGPDGILFPWKIF